MYRGADDTSTKVGFLLALLPPFPILLFLSTLTTKSTEDPYIGGGITALLKSVRFREHPSTTAAVPFEDTVDVSQYIPYSLHEIVPLRRLSMLEAEAADTDADEASLSFAIAIPRSRSATVRPSCPLPQSPPPLPPPMPYGP